MSRYSFPPINLNSPIEPQMVNRAQWVGYELTSASSLETGPRWRLTKGKNSVYLKSLLEVDMKLSAILEEIGDRIDKEQLDRMVAERAVAREAAERAAGLPQTENASDR